MKLTKFERLMLINAQPIKFWLNIVGGGIVLFFLWKHEFINAIMIGGAIIIAGTILAKKYSRLSDEEIARTRIGNVFLQYSTRLGLLCYLLSHILIPVSFWFHNLVFAGVGLMVLMAGLVGLKRRQ